VVSAPRGFQRRLSRRGRRGKKPARTGETAGRKHRDSVCVWLGSPNRAVSVGATLRGRSRKPVGVLRCMGLERAFAAERPSPSEREDERLRKSSRLSFLKELRYKNKVGTRYTQRKRLCKSFPPRRAKQHILINTTLLARSRNRETEKRTP
jgi:hypothetical protein